MKRRTPLKKVGARAERSREALDAFRDAIFARCWEERPKGYHCERCDEMQGALDAHHVVGRARAAGWPSLHDPELNGLGVCRRCHDALSINPRAAGWRASCYERIERAFEAFEKFRRGE